MKFESFENIFKDSTSNFIKVKKDDYKPSGTYPIVDQGQAFIGGYTDDEILVVKKNLPVIIFGDHTKIFKYVDFPFTIGADGVKVLILKNKKNNALFYYYFLKSIKIVDKGYSRHFKYLKEKRLPIADYPDQLHIASLLTKAENLISQRKESIRLLDEYLKSTFLEMFGDPVRNEKGWEVNSLSKFGSLKNGLNYTRSETGVSIRCLGVGDFKDFSKLSDIDSLPMLNLTNEPNNEYFLKNGDLVFVRSNGNRELVGRCLLVFPNFEKVTFSGFCIRYRIEGKGLNPVFLSHLFRVPIFKTSMLQGGKGANIQNISQQTLEKLKIPTPAMELQTQFAQIVEKTEALKSQYQQSLQELENLYGMLSQRAFRGELSLNKAAIMA